jgi:hypothetical protein
MTLPLDVPTAKPPADLQPATAPQLPPAGVAQQSLPLDPIAEIVGPAIVAALKEVDPHAYFSMLLRTDPRLFHKWASLLMARQGGNDNRTQNVINVVTAIPRSPLDELPKGFQVNG